MPYLGHLVGCGMLAVLEASITVMAEYKISRDKRLRSFQCSIEYYIAVDFAKLSAAIFS